MANTRATAKWTLFAAVPQWLVGHQLHHAYVVINPITRSIDFASDPVLLTFVR